MKPKLCIGCGKEVTYSLRKGRCSWCDKKARNDDPDKSKHKKRNDTYRERNPGMSARKHLLKRYGLTPQTFEAKKIQQHNKCQICLTTFLTTPHVDHNHETKEVRGLLCRKCNFGIGFFLEDEFRFARAVAYLRHYKAEPTGWMDTNFVDLRPTWRKSSSQ